MDWSIAQTPENGRPRERSADYGTAAFGALVIWALFAAADTRVLHWFILPVFACAILIGVDAVRWARGAYDTFDPKGIIGLYGVNYFFVSALIVATVPVVDSPHLRYQLLDYRPWLGLMGALNVVGLVLYRLTERWMSRRGRRGPQTVWLANPGPAFSVLAALILLTLVTQTYLFATEGLLQIAGAEKQQKAMALAGKGLLRMPGKAFPFIVMFALTLWRGHGGWRRTGFTVVALLLALGVGWIFLSSGLRGMRTVTILTALVLGGITHYFWRPVSRKLAVTGAAVLILFAAMYTFYKHGGGLSWRRFGEHSVSARIEAVGTRLQGMVIGDLSRTYVQAYMAYILVEEPYDYQYRWGWTAVGDVLKHVPHWLWRNRWNTEWNTGKTIAMTDMAMGPGHYHPYAPAGSIKLVGGLAGYTMLNFGILPIPLAFALWGLVVGRYRRGLRTWPRGDLRFFLAPFLTILMLYVLANDFDNIVSLFMFTFSLPLLVVLLIKKRYRYPDQTWVQEALPDTALPITGQPRAG